MGAGDLGADFSRNPELFVQFWFGDRDWCSLSNSTHNKLTFTAEAILVQFEAVLANAFIASLGQVDANVVTRAQLIAMTWNVREKSHMN